MSKKPLPSGQNDISNSHLFGLKEFAIENVKLLKQKIQFDIKISFVQVLIQKHDRMFIIFNNNHASLALSDWFRQIAFEINKL